MFKIIKKIILLFSILISLNSCQEKPFLSIFDKVEHYHLSNQSMLNYETRDSLLTKIIEKDYPSNLYDNDFYQKLKLNFSIKTFTNSNVEVFKNLFNKSTFTDVYTTACIPEYRDILILKKENEVIGIIKICVGCKMHYFVSKNDENKIIINSGGIENEELEELLKK